MLNLQQTPNNVKIYEPVLMEYLPSFALSHLVHLFRAASHPAGSRLGVQLGMAAVKCLTPDTCPGARAPRASRAPPSLELQIAGL